MAEARPLAASIKATIGTARSEKSVSDVRAVDNDNGGWPRTWALIEKTAKEATGAIAPLL